MAVKSKLTCRMFGFAKSDTELARDLLAETPRLGQHLEFDQTAQLDLVDLVIINESTEELNAAWQQIQARRSSQGLVLPDVLYVRDDAISMLHETGDSCKTGNIKKSIQRAEFFSQPDFSQSLSSWVFDWLTTSYARPSVHAEAATVLRLAA